ncbi:MAG: beta-galactosidase, partial [Muribaculaceae bacterium]|nr:beta-galactosidase [Muribaculaceae bacterium]
MKKLLLLFLMCMALVPGVAVGREVMSVNNDWNFRFAHQVAGRGQRVDLPHTWNAADALSGRPDYYRGMGVYERIVDWKPEWDGKKLFLRFKGANQVAEVFVDSRYVGGHRGGYGAFVFDVTDFLKHGGQSVVTVKVTNALDLGIMPLVGDFNMYGGLYRGVDLVAVEPLHISLNDYASPGVYLTQRHVSRKRADVETAVVVANAGRVSADAKVRLRVSDGKNVVAETVSPVTVAADSVVRAVGQFSIENPRLWNGRRDPFVYSAVAELIDGAGNVVDRVEQPLGLRWFEV